MRVLEKSRIPFGLIHTANYKSHDIWETWVQTLLMKGLYLLNKAIQSWIPASCYV